MAQSKFVRSGSGLIGGTYKCNECGKMTRETGEGESAVGVCLACWEYAGWENSHNDGYCNQHEDLGLFCPVCKAEKDALTARGQGGQE